MEWTFGPGVSSSSALLSWESKSIAGIFGGEGSPYSKRAALQGLSAASAFGLGLRVLVLLGVGGALDDAAGASTAGAAAAAAFSGDPMSLCADWICNGALRNAMIILLTGSLKRLPAVAVIPLSWQ